MKLTPNQALFDRTCSNLRQFFDQKILNYFSDLQNQSFSVL